MRVQAGKFAAQIVPVPVPQRKGPPKMFAVDEYIKADASEEKLRKLGPAFQKKNGTVTAGASHASVVADPLRECCAGCAAAWA